MNLNQIRFDIMPAANTEFLFQLILIHSNFYKQSDPDKKKVKSELTS